MNDFTKEELKEIYYRLENAPQELEVKIQAMIDNYCEHNDRVATSDENGHMLVMCGRCDMVLWHEKD